MSFDNQLVPNEDSNIPGYKWTAWMAFALRQEDEVEPGGCAITKIWSCCDGEWLAGMTDDTSGRRRGGGGRLIDISDGSGDITEDDSTVSSGTLVLDVDEPSFASKFNISLFWQKWKRSEFLMELVPSTSGRGLQSYILQNALRSSVTTPIFSSSLTSKSVGCYVSRLGGAH